MENRIKRHLETRNKLNKQVLTWTDFNHFVSNKEQIMWTKINPRVFNQIKHLKYDLTLNNTIKLEKDEWLDDWENFKEQNKDYLNNLQWLKFKIELITFYQQASFLDFKNNTVSEIYITRGIASPVLLDILKIEKTIENLNNKENKKYDLEKNLHELREVFEGLKQVNFNQPYKPKKVKLWMILASTISIGVIIIIVCACVMFIK